MPDGATLDQPDRALTMPRMVFYGHSHINGMVEALADGMLGDDVVYRKYQLRLQERRHRKAGIRDETAMREATLHGLSRLVWKLADRIGAPQPAKLPMLAKQHNLLTVMSIRGIQHVFRGLPASQRPYDFVLPENPDLPLIQGAEIVPYEMVVDYYRVVLAATLAHISQVKALVRHNVFHVEMPPPYESEEYILSKMGNFSIGQKIAGVALSPATLRYKLWRVVTRLYREHCAAIGVTWVPCPPETLKDGKYLHPDGWHVDAVHGNAWFGARMAEATVAAFRAAQAAPADMPAPPPHPPRSTTPYLAQPPAAFWRRAVGSVPAAEVDPVLGWRLTLTPETRVATAGSCFAQHIANRLAKSGFNYFVTETAPGDAASAGIARDYGYGLFSARYGNLYTSRQLVQLFDRAYGTFQPREDVWTAPGGRLIDPFRPNIQKGGFATRAEFDMSRETHFAAVRRMFEELDVFVFTLGLTEAWERSDDGAVYPLCPGVAGGSYDPACHRLHNLTAAEVTADLHAFLDRLRRVNPASQVILTVSPVPLIATATDRHVLTATTYSKSVLRVAAEEVSRGASGVHYFPSYEVITGAHARGAYLGEDLREVEEAGVNHVMRLFFRHAAPSALVAGKRRGPTDLAQPAVAPGGARQMRKAFSQAINIICDENSIEKHV